MYRDYSVLAIVPVMNEEVKIGEVCRRISREIVDELIVVDDHSTDRSAEVALQQGATVLRLDGATGVGAALRLGYQYAVDKGYDLTIAVAGNNKDCPEEIPQMLDPLVDDEADFVQGSRWLKPQPDLGDMPTYRKWATRLHPILFSLVSGKKVTESTSGFRAVRTSVFHDRRLNLDQDWLDRYELETYLYFKLIRLGYRTVEVPATKTYPPKSLGKQTKMAPVTGWWSVLRPLVYLGLRLRR